MSLTRRKTAPPQQSIKVLTGCHGAPLTVILTLNGNNACLKSVGGNKLEGVSLFWFYRLRLRSCDICRGVAA